MQYPNSDMPEDTHYDRPIRLALRELLMGSGKSRSRIAEELSRRLGRFVTENVLTNWASDSKGAYRMPADVVAALADDGLLRSLMSPEQLSKFDLGEWALEHLKLEGNPPAKAGADKAGASRRKRV
jgi:hypothetical protein